MVSGYLSLGGPAIRQSNPFNNYIIGREGGVNIFVVVKKSLGKVKEG